MLSRKRVARYGGLPRTGPLSHNLTERNQNLLETSGGKRLRVQRPLSRVHTGDWKSSTTTTQTAKKENLQIETLGPSTPTVDMEMLEKN